MPGRQVAELEVVHVELASEILCRIFQRHGCLGIDRRDAAIDGERQPDQGVAEKPAIDMSQRQDAADSAVILGMEKMRGMPEHLLDDLLPGRTMKEGRFRTRKNERVPTQCGGGVGRIEMPDLEHGLQALERKR